MIYLRRNGNSASTNDEEMAQKLEEQGFERLSRKEIFWKKVIPSGLGYGLAMGLGMLVFTTLPGSVADCGVACVLTLALAELFNAWND